MHRTCPSGNEWTTRDLLRVIERYVVRTRLSENDKKELGDVKNMIDSLVFDSSKALSHITRLMEITKGKLDLYGPPDQFMYDLDTLTNCPHNYQLLTAINTFNYGEGPRYLQDTKGFEYMSKNDVYLLIYRTFSSFCEEDDEVNCLVLMSSGNKIYRQLKNCYEIVPTDLVDKVCSSTTEVLTSLRKLMHHAQKRGFKLINHTVDEVYEIFAQFFDETYDVALLEQLRQDLKLYNEKKPINKYEEFYQALYLRTMIFNDTVGTICNRFPMIFQPYSKTKKTVKDHSPVVRVFKDAGAKFFLAKDLEYAITIALKIKFKNKALPGGLIPVENNDDKKRGILMTVDWEKFENVVKTLGLTIDDVHIIEEIVQRTSRNIATPIISQYGTHCKLATDAFYELFENVTTGMRLFQGVSKVNLPKVFEWFANLHDLFSDTRKTRYFIEIWKMDEIIDRAYEELQMFVTESIYNLPKKRETFDKKQTLKEVSKFSPNFKLNPENVYAMHFYFTKTLGLEAEISSRFVHQIYEHCVRLEFFKLNPKYTKFMHNQGVCESFRRLVCECQSESQDRCVEKTSKPSEQLEILREDYLIANRVQYDECFKSSIVTKDGQKFYDSETCFKLAIDGALVGLDDFKTRLAVLAYKAQSKKDEMQERRMFYLGEEEVQKIFEKTKKEFDDSIKYTNSRHEAQKKSILQTREICWNNIWETFEDNFPDNNETNGFIDDVKNHLKTHAKATKKGLLGNIVTELGEVCRQAQMCYQKSHLYTRSLTEYREKSGEKRRIVIRIMSEARVENQMDWHMFSEEALEAFRILLREENRYAVMSKTLEKMEMKWYIQGKCSTITVAEFEKEVELLRISKKKFILVPDIQYCHHLTNLPFRMGYRSVSIIEPSAQSSYHYTQAQYLLFQFLTCDIRWNLKSGDAGDYREAIIDEMQKLGKGGGYVLASTVDYSVMKLMCTLRYQQAKMKNVPTPLTICHGKRYNDKISKSEFLEFVEQICDEKFAVTFKSVLFLKLMGFDEMEDVKEIEVWKVRFVFMKFWIETFFEGESELKENVMKAWTVSLAHLNLPKMEDFKIWKSTISNMPNKYVNFDDFVFVMLTMQKNREKDFEFTEDDLVTKHSWTVSLDESSSMFQDCLVANAIKREPNVQTKEVTTEKEKILESMFGGNFKDKSSVHSVQIVTDPKENEKIVGEQTTVEVTQKNAELNDKAVERTLNNVLEHVDIVLPLISSKHFITVDTLEDIVCEFYENAISIEDFELLPLIIKEDLNKLKMKFHGVFEFQNINGKECFRKIRRPGMPPTECCTSESEEEEEKEGVDDKEDEFQLIQQMKQIMKLKKQTMCEKKDEQPSTSVKVVQQCETCEENSKLIKEVQSRFKDIEEQIEDKEITLIKATQLVDEYKKTSESETNKLRADLKNRDKRIHQIQQQKKKEAENYANWKKEQTKKFDNVKEQFKSSNEKVCELTNELQQSKSSENKTVQEKNRLINENRELKLKIEELTSSCESMQTTIREKFGHIQVLENRLGQLEQLRLLQARSQPVPVVLTPPPMAYPTPKRCPIVQQKMEEYEQILRMDVQGMMKVIDKTVERFAEKCLNPQEVLSAKMDVSNFVKQFKIFMEVVSKKLQFCQKNIGVRVEELTEIPTFPAPFSKSFMQNYERSLKKSKERKCWKKVEDRKEKELESAPVVLTPPPMAYPTPKRCPIVQQKMEEYEQILRMDVQGMMKMIDKTVERFAEKCQNPQELLSANMEVPNFVKQFKIFMEVVAKQMQLCQKNIGVRVEELTEIPTFPAPFSDFFMQNYEQSLKKSKERKSWKKIEDGKEKELEDDECSICYEDMNNNNVTKCAKCSTKYHSECVSEWSKRMATCPVCRSSLPDPQEFPEL